MNKTVLKTKLQKPIIKVVVAVFSQNKKKILFQLDNEKTFLRFPGGKLKFGETFEDCIKREIEKEEYKFKITNIKPWILFENFFECDDSLNHEILIIQSANLLNEEIEFPISHIEISEIQIDWFEISELFKYKVVPIGIKKLLNLDIESTHHYSNFQ